MRHPSFRLGIPVLCLFVGLAGCRVPQPAQQKTAGLTVDVQKVKNGRRGVEVSVKIGNEHDLKISFDPGDVRLLVGNGVEVSPNTNQRGNPQRLEVQPKNGREFRWIFPVETALQPGSYTIEIKSFREDDVEYPNKAVFTINV